jgi:hypothetical protein
VKPRLFSISVIAAVSSAAGRRRASANAGSVKCTWLFWKPAATTPPSQPGKRLGAARHDGFRAARGGDLAVHEDDRGVVHRRLVRRDVEARGADHRRALRRALASGHGER